MFINSVVQRNSTVFHLELRSSDVYSVYNTRTTPRRCSQRRRTVAVWVSVWTEWTATSTLVGDTKLFPRLHACVRVRVWMLCSPRQYIDHIITLGKRDGISIPRALRCRIATLPPAQQSIWRRPDKKIKSIIEISAAPNTLISHSTSFRKLFNYTYVIIINVYRGGGGSIWAIMKFRVKTL